MIMEREQRVNVAISRIRCKVKHTFDSIHRRCRGRIVRYTGLAKPHAQHTMGAVAYNLCRSPGIVGILLNKGDVRFKQDYTSHLMDCIGLKVCFLEH